MAQHHHTINNFSNPPTGDQQFYPNYHSAHLPPGLHGQTVEHPPPLLGQHGQMVKHQPLPPGPYGHYKHLLSISSFNSDNGFYNLTDYYQTGVAFQQMVHRLSEENTRSDLSTVLVGSSNAFDMATMLPIA